MPLLAMTLFYFMVATNIMLVPISKVIVIFKFLDLVKSVLSYTKYNGMSCICMYTFLPSFNKDLVTIKTLTYTSSCHLYGLTLTSLCVPGAKKCHY